jgi:hypothetical protein
MLSNWYCIELEVRQRQREIERKAATAWMFERSADGGPGTGRRLLGTVGDFLIAVGQRLRGPEVSQPPARIEDAALQA